MELKNNIHKMTDQASTDQALKFLDALDKDGWHNLVAIDPDANAGDKGKVQARTFGPGEKDAMRDWIDARQGKRNLYFSVNEPSPDAPNNKLKKGDIVAVRAVYIDVDPHAKSQEEYAAERERIENLRSALNDDWLCPPTAVIDSGGGYQFFWFLSEKLDAKDNTQWAEAQGNALAIHYGGDSTFDVNRIMRLPGTVNLPDANKRAKGRKRAPTKLLDLVYGDDNRYGKDILSQWHEPQAPVTSPSQEANSAYPELDVGEISSIADVEDLPPALTEKLASTLNKDKRLKAVWDGAQLDGEDQSGSAYLFSLANALRRAGDYTPTEFGMIAMGWPQANLANKPDPIRQIARAWSRATATSATEDFEPAELEQPSVPKRELYFVMGDAFADSLGQNEHKPLIKGLLDQKAMTVVYGKSNVGKTFVALDLSHCIATGNSWRGHKTEQGLVIYVAAEGGLGIKKRLKALRIERGTTGLIAVVPCPINLLDSKGDTKALVELIAKAEAETGHKAMLVVIDTLARAMAGGDENSSEDMGAFIRHVDAIRAHSDAHVMVIHHSGKDEQKGARGHSSLRAATDTEIEIKDGEITVQKQRDLEPIQPVKFTLKSVKVGMDADGEDVSSCVVTYGEAEGDFAEPKQFPLTPAERKFFFAVCDLAEEKCEKLGWDAAQIPQIKFCAADFEAAFTRGEYDVEIINEGDQGDNTEFSARAKSLKSLEGGGVKSVTPPRGKRRYVKDLRSKVEQKGYLKRTEQNQWVITGWSKVE